MNPDIVYLTTYTDTGRDSIPKYAYSCGYGTVITHAVYHSTIISSYYEGKTESSEER